MGLKEDAEAIWDAKEKDDFKHEITILCVEFGIGPRVLEIWAFCNNPGWDKAQKTKAKSLGYNVFTYGPDYHSHAEAQMVQKWYEMKEDNPALKPIDAGCSRNTCYYCKLMLELVFKDDWASREVLIQGPCLRPKKNATWRIPYNLAEILIECGAIPKMAKEKTKMEEINGEYYVYLFHLPQEEDSDSDDLGLPLENLTIE